MNTEAVFGGTNMNFYKQDIHTVIVTKYLHKLTNHAQAVCADYIVV